MNKKIHVKKDDTVLILSGVDRGKKGKALAVSPKEGKVVVEGRNMVKKHVKPQKAGEVGGIIESASAIYASKVMVICPHCNKPTRIGHEKLADKSSVRKCKRCGDTL